MLKSLFFDAENAVSGWRMQPTHRERMGKDMSAIEAGVRAPENPWREEMRAMLQLSWPMILTNLGQESCSMARISSRHGFSGARTPASIADISLPMRSRLSLIHI